MRKSLRVVKMSALLLAAILCVQCTSEANTDKKQAQAGQTAGDTTTLSGGLKVAYIDSDSLMKGYNFAKDVAEAMLRGQNKLENALQQKNSEIQRFAGEMDRKYQSNGYLSEASFNADRAKLQQMQNDAQNYMANLNRSVENEMMMNNQQLSDSIDKFISEFAKAKGYQIILHKDATWYIGDVDDVTAEVIQGLNERYTKVDSKE